VQTVGYGLSATGYPASLPTKGRAYPSRIPCRFEGRDGEVVLDQLRTVDKRGLAKRLGSLNEETQEEVLAGLLEMFAL
jgi:mRNA interferase MazF